MRSISLALAAIVIMSFGISTAWAEEETGTRSGSDTTEAMAPEFNVKPIRVEGVTAREEGEGANPDGSAVRNDDDDVDEDDTLQGTGDPLKGLGVPTLPCGTTGPFEPTPGTPCPTVVDSGDEPPDRSAGDRRD